jgi:peptidoglycan/LPS O-acetylase OafA/YrhL
VAGRDFAYFFTLCRLDGLALGAVGAIVMLDPRLRERARPAVQWVGRFWWVVPLLLLIPRGLSLYFGTLLLIVGYLGLVLAADMGTLAARPSRWLNSNFLRKIGGYGYAIYLFSLPIAQVTRKIQPTGAVLVDGLFSMAATLAVSYVLAWISWNVLESRFLRLKSRFAYVPESPAAR